MKRKLNLFTLLLGISLLMGGCASPGKMIDVGNYDEAIDIAIRRMAGKEKLKEKYINALEEGFKKANQRDMNTANRLKNEQRAENWPKIYSIYKGIRKRQEKVSSFLPMSEAQGIDFDFAFVIIDDLEREAKENAVAYYYDNGVTLMAEARRGNRMAAREAYASFGQIKSFFSRYKDEDRLMNEALELGTTYILVSVANRSNQIMPNGMKEALLQLDERSLNSQWKIFHTGSDSQVDYDYEVILELTNLFTGPERVSEREYTDTRKIEDGEEYVLDENGNVAKDSLGNDIKVPRIVEIKAFVLENYQSKEAALRGRMRFIDLYRDRVMNVEEISAQALFENYAATYRGDRRALSRESQRKIGNRPVPFPSDFEMLMRAADRLKPAISRELRRSNILN